MKYSEKELLETVEHEVITQLRHNIVFENPAETLELLTEALSIVKPNSRLQRDITEGMVDLINYTGKIAPIDTIEALSKSVLWVPTEYIPHFAKMLLLMQRAAIDENPNRALAAIEHSLLVCYSAIMPKNIHGTMGSCDDECLEWQRQTFSSVIHAAETKPFVEPAILESILRISEIMTDMNPRLQDLNQKIRTLSLQKLLARKNHP